jgi:hypothetical protein
MTPVQPTVRLGPGEQMLARAGIIGVVGSLLGSVAGLVELSVGGDIGDWVGNKTDTASLGVVTIALSLVALIAAVASLNRPVGAGRRFAVALGLLVPGVVGFTTVGRLWYLPGALLVVSGMMVLVAAHQTGQLAATLSRNWGRILISVLAAIYAFLGILAWNPATALALAGTAAIFAALAVARRSPAQASLLLVGGALPFALITWWSVVAPLTAALLLVIGLPEIWRSHRVALPVAKTEHVAADS